MSPRAWSFLTIDGVRQYGGNVGYEDDPAKVYRYDSDVANCRQVKKDDVVILRSRTEIICVAEIGEILEGQGHKERLRCPICRATNIKKRGTKTPEWACKNQHSFDDPTRETVAVHTFEAHYADTFRLPPQELTTTQLQDAVLRPSDQMSIKEIDLAKIERFLSIDPSYRQLVVAYASAISPDATPHSMDDTEAPQSIIAARRRVLREVNLRRGQQQFRDRLIRLYGAACQVSRCAFPSLVEAAHIMPYAQTNDHSAHNGLLLRSDLHTLFDLGLMAINPLDMRVSLHPDLLLVGYASFDGASLFTNGTNGPNRDALRERWEFFQTCLQRQST
ncbi:putative restriction endonuclease [Paraburkholderia sp. WC7.3g]|uniref:HNH endonuclease n=1 Tax=Paraburkholderia sp. WC7.3g TaxID=2991070 RepID=UPI003D1CF5F0